MNKRCFRRTYYTLADLIKLCEGDSLPVEYKLSQYYADGFKQILLSVFSIYSTEDLDTIIKSEEVARLWSIYVAPYRLKEYIIYKDSTNFEEQETISAADFQDWLILFVNKIKYTYEKYKTILDFYADNKAKLMDSVKTINTARFNDTPQNAGDFSGEDYTTNYTESTSSNELATIMTRLAEIDARYKDIYSDWAKEFDNLFFSTPEGD